MLLVVIVALVLLTTFVIGTLVLLRGVGTKVNATFVILAYSVTFWMLANFLGANFKSSSFAGLASRLDFVSGTWLAFSVWSFSSSLLVLADVKRRWRRLYDQTAHLIVGAMTVIAALVTFLPAVITEHKLSGQPLVIEYGRYYIIYAGVLGAVIFLVGVNLILARRQARGRLRSQLDVMLSSLLIGAFAISFANLALPSISSSETINLVAGDLSYIGIAFFLAGTSYSIVRQRLFDLRLVLARSLAYILLFAVLAGAYTAFTLIISSLFVQDYKATWSSSVVPIFSLALLTFTAQPLAKYFNKFTNRLFYKDSYDSQAFLAQVSKAIVNTISASKLLENVSVAIQSYIKVGFVVFDLNSDTSLPSNVRVSSRIKSTHLSLMHDVIDKGQAEKVIITDELAKESHHLKQLLEDDDIAMVLRLATQSGDFLGHVFVGGKKNGGSLTPQDINVLEIATDELVIALQNAARFEQIQGFNVTLQDEVDTATHKLKLQNKRLEELDNTKDDFISMASHQLRTPLTSVKGYLSMVLEGDAGKINTQQSQMLSQAFASSQRMVFLITDLLNVSRLKTGKFVIDATPTDLSAMVAEELTQLGETARVKNIKLSYDRPKDFPSLMLDQTKIRQVIMNFVDNALYYTPPGGRINVELKDLPSAVELRVIDNGIGVPKDEQHHLFTKFYRAANARKARPDGTGLGLFMAQKVIIAEGGSVIFSSKEGQGSTFGFRLPKAKLHVPDVPPKSAEPPAATKYAPSAKPKANR